ncbi:hypothetical protein HOU00_gp192 [Caulobacter phage CcrPW]|uniref:Uncharacterized protein n=1 Tax=Caulobacter phage CcrPW TaxID=2283271 RepID=A0A385EAW7_9CAUD|nr:hypothetical protein HOU00_gp192 [Caulobacter phage CcrPW]AXQ68933.1 hypothetical protein CcrPW_gp394 [Caulobacter phage CcrPW]
MLAEIIFDYMSKLMRDAFDAADPFHREYLVHRRLGRFMRGDPIDFVNQRPPGEMSWSGKGDQCVEFIHVRRPGTRDAGWPGITRDWFERKVALEGDHEIGAGFDMLHMLQEDAVTQVSLIQTLRDLHDAFASWTAQTVKQEQAIAAAKQVLAVVDDYAGEPDISSESREVITDIFGTAVLVSDKPVLFTVHEVDIMLKAQRALTTHSIDPAGMKSALERIERWFGEFPDTGKKREDGTPLPYWFCFGSNGERDYMRSVARAALARVPPSFEDAVVESIREFADQVLSAAQDCCTDPDAGPDATTTVRFTGEEGCEIGTALHRLVGAVAKGT